ASDRNAGTDPRSYLLQSRVALSREVQYGNAFGICASLVCAISKRFHPCVGIGTREPPRFVSFNLFPIAPQLSAPQRRSGLYFLFTLGCGGSDRCKELFG